MDSTIRVIAQILIENHFLIGIEGRIILNMPDLDLSSMVSTGNLEIQHTMVGTIMDMKEEHLPKITWDRQTTHLTMLVIVQNHLRKERIDQGSSSQMLDHK